MAAVLPEDRADILYHSFDGGGAEISGPSLLVRKKFSENISTSVNYYVDNVSSASIDVITTASPYTENRKENTISVDYLNHKSTISMGVSNSSENDFDASTLSFNLSQDMFGDLTTVSMGFAMGDNTVGKNGDDTFSEKAKTQNYRVSVSQVITKDMLAVFALETITDEGYLNNPYRTVRYLDNTVPSGYSYQGEVYPKTRTSNAIAIRAINYLPYRAAVQTGYRFFVDTWGIQAHTLELIYTHPFEKEWIFDLSYRYYSQTKADFYSDLFPFQDAQNFLARDKELSTYNDHTLGFGVSYEFAQNGTGLIKRGSLNFNYDYILFDYSDFSDLTSSASAGNEPDYGFDAGVIRMFVSVWF